MQFLVIGHDDNDEGALQRRLDNRSAHLDNAKALKEQGILLDAGAMLDESEKMIGSMILFEAENKATVEQLIAQDPYTRNGVWVKTDITQVRLAFRS